MSNDDTPQAKGPQQSRATLDSEALPSPPPRGNRPRPYASMGRDLTKGSIPRNLWWLAWPQIVESSLNTLDQFADLVWAGFIGAGTIAGVGVAQSYKQLVMTGRMGMDTAMRAIVSRAIGARDPGLANHAVLQGFTISGGFSLLVVVIGAILTIPLMRVLGVSTEVIESAATYLRIQFIGTGALAFRQTSGMALLAAGDAVTPMKATLLTRVTHIVLTPFLVFGWLFFPEMGIAGAALADLLAQSLGATWNLKVLFSGTSRLHLTLKGYFVDFPMLWRLIRIGLPASVTGMERSLIQLVAVGLAAQFGTLSLAAYALTRRAENLAHLGSGGLGRASGILVGQNLGAGNPERAKQTMAWAQVYVVFITLGVTLLLAVFAPLFVTIFTRDPELVALASTWLRILSISFAFLGIGMVFAESFNTAGDTMAPMVITLVSMWGIELPLALTLTGATHNFSVFGLSTTLPVLAELGTYGIAWAIVIAMTVRALLYVPYYYWGRWLRVKVA